MKHSTPHRPGRGFTLIEMLVVISIIGVLAGLLLPVLGRVKIKGRIQQANAEIRNLATAITAYQALYSIYPSSPTDASGGRDVTYDTGNRDQVVILLDVSTNLVPVNLDHKRNPQNHVFLNGKIARTVTDPGIGPDYNFRDPWGTPYVITLDLNYDNACDDRYYSPFIGKIPAPVAVWSMGPNKRPFGSGVNPRPTDRDNDDIRSW